MSTWKERAASLGVAAAERTDAGSSALGVVREVGTGASVGAGIGSAVFPGLGTAIGAGVGALAGAVSWLARWGARRRARRRSKRDARRAELAIVDPTTDEGALRAFLAATDENSAARVGARYGWGAIEAVGPRVLLAVLEAPGLPALTLWVERARWIGAGGPLLAREEAEQLRRDVATGRPADVPSSRAEQLVFARWDAWEPIVATAGELELGAWTPAKADLAREAGYRARVLPDLAGLLTPGAD